MNRWRKSSRSFSNGNCAEVRAWRKSSVSINDSGAGSECAEVSAWHKARACVSNHCAEVGTGDAVVGVRDTKQAQLGEARTVLEFSPGAWGRFLTQVGQGSAE